jgi:hypothetical protein
MTFDAQLCVLTWERDLNWLNACLRSVQKFWRSDYAPLIIATPECEKMMPRVVKELGCSVRYEPKRSDGRLGQQYIKMMSDTYTKAPLLLHTDSDCLFNRPVTAESFAHNGKPIVVMEDYDEILKDAIEPDRICLRGYQSAAEELLGVRPQYEFMRRHPFFFWTSTIRDMRKVMETRAGVTLMELLTRYHSGQMSEFNFMGTFAHYFEHDQYEFRLPKDAGPDLIKQFHSWSQDPNTQEYRARWKLQCIPPPEWSIEGVVHQVTEILSA